MRGKIHYAASFYKIERIGTEGGKPPIILDFYEHGSRRHIGRYVARLENGEIVRHTAGELFGK